MPVWLNELLSIVSVTSLVALVWFAAKVHSKVDTMCEDQKEHKDDCNPHRNDLEKRLTVVETVQGISR